MKSLISASLIAAAGLGPIILAASPAAAIPVFDSANYTQNLLGAARALEQIDLQIRSLQNQAAMLDGMAKNLSRIDFPELQALRARLERVNDLLDQAQSVGFRVDALERDFNKLFPGDQGALRSDQRLRDAQSRLDASLAGLRQTMAVQSLIVENIHDDGKTLDAIVARSQNARGIVEASQATNQLLSLAARQQFQLQQLLAAQFRSDALDRARRVHMEGEARAATRRFLGSGKAYTPR